MSQIKLLDCTLRDGGYVNNWDFSMSQISDTIATLTNAGIDYVEIGYLTSILGDVNGSRFFDVETASKVLPDKRVNTKYVIMADVSQFDTNNLCIRSKDTVDGIRVVFYKRQIDQAYSFCEKVCKQGFELFLQPMVTVDYTQQELAQLVKRFNDNYDLFSVAVVDSFGCMNAAEVQAFVEVLDKCVDNKVSIGFHAHDNMQRSLSNVTSLCNLKTKRDFIFDASVGGIGRGAGNLRTELAADYLNEEFSCSYDIEHVLQVMSDVVEPISRKYKWGYSPYFFITAQHRSHPNFATFLIADHNISVKDFSEFIKLIPDEMKTKCTRPYVEELYKQFIEKQS